MLCEIRNWDWQPDTKGYDVETGAHELVQERDHFRPRRFMVVAGVTVVIGVLAVVAAWGLLRLTLAGLTARGKLETPGAPRAIAGPVSGVEQSMYSTDLSGQVNRADRAAELKQYRWVDKDRGIIAIPVDKAMQVLAQPNPPEGAPRCSMN